MVSALLICSLYDIASFRRLCSAISGNIAYRWFCFLTIDEPVFDHSSISHFIDRIGRDGFGAVFDGLNAERARQRNQTAAYQREPFRRRTIAEGIFASLDRLGWEKSRLRGLWKVDSEGYMSALAQNVLKIARRLRRCVRPPGPVVPADAVAADADYITGDAAWFCAALAGRFGSVNWWPLRLRPALQ